VYSGTDEVSGTGYTSGGNTITGITIATSPSGVVFLSFDTVSWPGSTLQLGARLFIILAKVILL
jgi:hypothetical protein